MNCVNCGAPPTRGSKDCIYCETPLAVKRPDANEAGFRSALRAIRSASFDSYKAEAICSMRGHFTAGQVLALLKEFSFDSYRVEAAGHLVPLTLNRSMLLDGAELFSFDSYRAEFIELVGYTNTPEEEAPEEPPARKVRVGRQPDGPVRPRPPWGIILLALVAVAFILKTC